MFKEIAFLTFVFLFVGGTCEVVHPTVHVEPEPVEFGLAGAIIKGTLKKGAHAAKDWAKKHPKTVQHVKNGVKHAIKHEIEQHLHHKDDHKKHAPPHKSAHKPVHKPAPKKPAHKKAHKPAKPAHKAHPKAHKTAKGHKH